MSYDSNLKTLIRTVSEQGFKHELSSKGHHRFLPPDPKLPIVIMSGSPGDQRSWNNFLSQLKRSGAVLEKTAKPRRQERGFTSKILKILMEKPGKVFTAEDAAAIFSARNPNRGAKKTPVRALVNVALSDLHATGDIVKVAHGQYTWKPAAVPAPAAAVEPAPAPVLVAPTLGDPDLKALTDALYVALSTIEQIITKHNKLYEQHQRMKEKLKELLV